MPNFDVAHIREQGVDLIIILLGPNFQYQTQQQKNDICEELQARATAAGLIGTVVPVWQHGRQMSFMAPPNWHPFFRGLSWQMIMNNVNRTLSW